MKNKKIKFEDFLNSIKESIKEINENLIKIQFKLIEEKNKRYWIAKYGNKEKEIEENKLFEYLNNGFKEIAEIIINKIINIGIDINDIGENKDIEIWFDYYHYLLIGIHKKYQIEYDYNKILEENENIKVFYDDNTISFGYNKKLDFYYFAINLFSKEEIENDYYLIKKEDLNKIFS